MESQRKAIVVLSIGAALVGFLYFANFALRPADGAAAKSAYELFVKLKTMDPKVGMSYGRIECRYWVDGSTNQCDVIALVGRSDVLHHFDRVTIYGGNLAYSVTLTRAGDSRVLPVF